MFMYFIQSNAKKVVAFLILTTSHYFCIRLGNQEYSRSQLPTKMEKLEDWTKQPKTSCLLFFALDSTVEKSTLFNSFSRYVFFFFNLDAKQKIVFHNF
jgi:hypothetical protein